MPSSTVISPATVLVEHPDGAMRWAMQATFEAAGHRVLTCSPAELAAGCPLLLASGRCSLADAADAVVCSTDLPIGDALVAAHRQRGTPVLVEERASAGLFATGERLCAAVDVVLAGSRR